MHAEQRCPIGLSRAEEGGFSIHADWFNGWDAEVVETWIDNCIRQELDCEQSQLGDGRQLF